MAPNEGRNNWCDLRLQDFDFETFRDFFRLRDKKSSSAKACWHCLEGRPCIYFPNHFRTSFEICLNRGLRANEIFKRKIQQPNFGPLRRNLNRLLAPNTNRIICKGLGKIYEYEVNELCQHACTENCKKTELTPKPCFIEELQRSIDL